LLAALSQWDIENLGYRDEKCIGLSVFDLWPAFLQEMHRKMFHECLENQKFLTTAITKQPGYIKAAAGYYIPAHAYACVHPYIQDEFQYVGVIKPVQLKRDFIVIRPSGVIEAWSQNIGEALGLNGAPVKNIQDLLVIKQEKPASTAQSFRSKSSALVRKMPENEQAKGYNLAVCHLLGNRSEEIVLTSGINRVKAAIEVHKKSYLGIEVIVVDMEVKYKDVKPKCEAEEIEDIPSENNSDSECVENRLVYQPAKIISQDKVKFDIKIIHKRTVNLEKTGTSPTQLKSYSYADLVTDSGYMKKYTQEFKLQEDTNSLSSQLKRNSNKMLEEAIYSVKLPRSVMGLYISSAVFVILCLILLLFICIKTSRNLELAQNNSEIIKACYSTFNAILTLEILARFLSSTSKGVMQPSRFDPFGIPSIYMLAPLLPSIGQSLDVTANDFLTNLRLIDQELQDEIYKQKFQVNRLGTVLEVNIFDYTNILVTLTLKFATQPMIQDYSKNEDILFVHDTILDMPVTIGNRLPEILYRATTIKLDESIHLSLTSVSFISAFGVYIIIFLAWSESVLRKERDRFVEIFLRLDERMIEENLRLSQQFYHSLNNGTGRNYELKEKKSSKSLILKEQAKNVKRKSANSEGMNKSMIILNIFTFILIGLFIFSFVAVLEFQNKRNSKFQRQASYEYQLNKYSYEYNQLEAANMKYISDNRTGVIAGQPVSEYIEGLYSTLINSEIFFGEMIDYYSDNSTLVELIKGNICKYQDIASSSSLYSLCLTIAGSALTRGIIGVNKQITSGIRMSKDYFDNSAHSFSDQVTALSFKLLPDIEIAFFYLVFPIYTSISTGIRENQTRYVENYRSDLVKLTVSMGFLFLALSYLMYMNIKLHFENRIVVWRKFIRVIPYKVYAKNKVLASYLSKISGRNI